MATDLIAGKGMTQNSENCFIHTNIDANNVSRPEGTGRAVREQHQRLRQRLAERREAELHEKRRHERRIAAQNMNVRARWRRRIRRQAFTIQKWCQFI